MKSIRQASLRSLLILAALCLSAVAASAQAQSRDARFISAKAGSVNYVSGKVAFKRAGETRWVMLSTNDDLKTGDAVKTGDNGRAEVLLNPGSYLRLGANAEFELADASLDDLQLGLKAGSAVIEATGYSELDLSIEVETPQTLARIVRSGIYRFDVRPGGVTEVSVQKGRAYVGSPEVLYKGGKVVRVGAGGALEVAKYEKKDRDRDELDIWSRERGRELARMNANLSRRQANALLASASLEMFPSRFAAGGVWYYNSISGCYTFLPFGGYGYWRSPYGHYYGNQLLFPFGCSGCNYGGGAIVRNSGGGGGSNAIPTTNSPTANNPTNNNPMISNGGSGGLPGSINAGGSSREPVVTGTSAQPMMVIPGRGKDN